MTIFLWDNDFSLGHDDCPLGMMKWCNAIEAIFMKNVFFQTVNLFASCAYELKTSRYSEVHYHPRKCDHQFFPSDH